MKESSTKSSTESKSFKTDWKPIAIRIAKEAAVTAGRGFVGAIGYRVGMSIYDRISHTQNRPNLRVLHTKEKVG